MRVSLRHRIIVCFLTGGIFLSSSAQQPAVLSDPRIQQAIEEVVRQQQGSGDIAEITDYLQKLLNHPVDLNTATQKELESLLFLNDFQIAALLEYRRQTGPLLSLNELQLVYGFDREMIRRLSPFVTVQGGRDTPSRTQKLTLRQEILTRVRLYAEKEQGYHLPATPEEGSSVTRYHGSRPGLLFRYTLDAGKEIHAGLVGDKDPGEPFFRGVNRQGFDFYSWYLQWSPRRGWLRQVNAGHYHLRLGQGLLLWNGFSINRPSAVLDDDRHAPQLRYASSSVEDNYLQGVSLVVGRGRFSVTPFYSFVRRDARLLIPDSLDPAERIIVSFPSSGLHRTTTEIERKSSAAEHTAGIRIGYQQGPFSSGINGLYTAWQYPFSPEEKPENILLHRGRELFAASIDYRYLYHRLSLFGEAALTHRGKGAFLQGARWYLSPLVTASLLVRYYDPAYFSPYAQAYSRSSKVNNEKGVLLGILLRPAAGLTITGDMDLYHFPWLRYGSHAPSGGTETRITLIWRPSEQLEFYLRYRREEREHDLVRPDDPLRQLTQQCRDHLRIQVSYDLTAQLQASNRLDMISFDESTGQPRDHGYFISQDLRYHPARIPLSLVMRFGLFDTQYPTRVYTYENDLLYAFSTPSLTGKGIRWYLTGSYRLQRHLYAGFRIARTSWSDRLTAGSGPATVMVPHRTEIKTQIRIKF
jgi:hypothetical protein